MRLLDAVRDRLVFQCRTKSRTLVVAPGDDEPALNLQAPSVGKEWSKSAAAVAAVLAQWAGGWRAGERRASRTTIVCDQAWSPTYLYLSPSPQKN